MPSKPSEQLSFQYNRALFGRDASPRLLAFEVDAADRMQIFSRGADGTVRSETVSFEPFLMVASEDLLKGWRGECRTEPLDGQGTFRRLVFFPHRDALDSAKSYLQRKSGKSLSAPGVPYLYINDLIHQYLLLSGKTHFLSMPFGELRRMQIDLETYCESGFEFPNPKRDGDRITAIAMSDTSGWERVLSGKEYDEAEMLHEMVREVQRRDPDVIEGHNLFRFDLEYIQTRGERYGVALKLGRDGSLLKGHASRLQVAERTFTYRRYEIFGRHIIDTWILAQHYDIATRELEGHGLKDIARHFGIASADRTYIPGAKASWYFDHKPDILFSYALDDVRETRGISEILSPSYYTQAQIFPYRYQDMPLRGNATKIDGLFIREYLAQRHAIPEPMEEQGVMGGFTDLQYQGVARNVLHCDMTSLYPSIMLAYRYWPKSDELHVLADLLGDLRDFRVRAKELARRASSQEVRLYFSALQFTFKVLINSFYGYLGFPLGHFNDFDAANQVTAKGRELIRSAAGALQQRGARVIEIDTDGIYFVPPPGSTCESERALIEELKASLPPGIEIELDGRYRAMFSYKVKNYALLDTRGRLFIKGSGLRSRGLERFQRKWLEEMLRLLLQGKKHEIRALYDRYRLAIQNHEMDISLLMKTETLQESLDTYQVKVKGGKRNPAGAYELALQSERPYKPGDQISYYVTGDSPKVKVNENCKRASEWSPENPDENVEYYKAKLKDLYEKFRPMIGEE